MDAEIDKRTTAAWQIRDFPIWLREEIVQAAAHEDVSVTTFAARVFLAARHNGWHRAGVPSLTPGSDSAPPLLDLVRVVTELTVAGAPRSLRRVAARALAARLEPLAGPPRAPLPRLAHAKGEADPPSS